MDTRNRTRSHPFHQRHSWLLNEGLVVFFFLCESDSLIKEKNPSTTDAVRRQGRHKSFGIPQGFAATASKSKLVQSVMFIVSFFWGIKDKKWWKSTVCYTQGQSPVNPTQNRHRNCRDAPRPMGFRTSNTNLIDSKTLKPLVNSTM